MRFRLLLPALILTLPLLSSCSLFAQKACSVGGAPATPVLLSVTQDPQTLQVTADIQDTSNNEQWIALERSYTSRFTRPGTVGISVETADREKLPLNKQTGETVTIVDRGFVGAADQGPGELTPGEIYSYRARSWNCYGYSDASNDISITALQPPQ